MSPPSLPKPLATSSSTAKTLTTMKLSLTLVLALAGSFVAAVPTPELSDAAIEAPSFERRSDIGGYTSYDNKDGKKDFGSHDYDKKDYDKKDYDKKDYGGYNNKDSYNKDEHYGYDHKDDYGDRKGFMEGYEKGFKRGYKVGKEYWLHHNQHDEHRYYKDGDKHDDYKVGY